ncbi:MAG: glycosyl transferase family 1 [Clostridia bacterium]|nr:glycosyl transferase family 1 [Clostridia bacterium]
MTAAARPYVDAAGAGPAPLATVVYPPTLDWNWMTQRPQQLLARLARRGFRVIYCNQRQVRGAPLQAVAPNLYLCHDFTALRQTPLAGAVIYATWGCHHELFGSWGARLNVFDNVDDFEAWETCDRQAAARADVVLAASQPLYERWAGLRRGVHLVPNACDYEHFARAAAPAVVPPPDLAGLPRPLVGYVGALAAWVDGELVEALARAYPTCTFVFIGPYLGWRPPALPNCHHLGLKPYAELPAYMARIDLFLIPFRLDRVTRAASPIKFFEYAATGRPILATALPELLPYAGAVHLARDGREMVSLLPFALADQSPQRAAMRQAIARANTWDARADAVAGILRQALGM